MSSPQPLRGSLELPGDKSISHRALILGALARRGLLVKNLADGEDVRSTRRCLEGLGVRFETVGSDLQVVGRGEEQSFTPPLSPLDCGNSGTTMRLLAGVLAGQPFKSTLVGDESLSRRPMGRIAEPLRRMGAGVDLAGDAHAPMVVRGRRPLQAIRYDLKVASAQVKSAILLAGLFGDGVTRVDGLVATRDHTERMLAQLSGGACMASARGCAVMPGALEGGGELRVPGDPSSAAFFLAAATLVPGSDLRLPSVSLNPGRTAFAAKLVAMGAQVRTEPDLATAAARPWEAGEPLGDMRALGVDEPLRAVDVAAHEVAALVDEVPILAVVATQAHGVSRIRGLAELRHKESDRLGSVAAGLTAMGARVEIAGDDLVITGPTPLHGARIDTHGDHRLVMAFAVAALVAEGETDLGDTSCVAVSFPGFFAALESLRA